MKVGRSWVMRSLVEGVGSLRKTKQRKDVVTFKLNVVTKVFEWLTYALAAVCRREGSREIG